MSGVSLLTVLLIDMGCGVGQMARFIGLSLLRLRCLSVLAHR